MQVGLSQNSFSLMWLIVNVTNTKESLDNYFTIGIPARNVLNLSVYKMNIKENKPASFSTI